MSTADANGKPTVELTAEEIADIVAEVVEAVMTSLAPLQAEVREVRRLLDELRAENDRLYADLVISRAELGL